MVYGRSRYVFASIWTLKYYISMLKTAENWRAGIWKSFIFSQKLNHMIQKFVGTQIKHVLTCMHVFNTIITRFQERKMCLQVRNRENHRFYEYHSLSVEWPVDGESRCVNKCKHEYNVRNIVKQLKTCCLTKFRWRARLNVCHTNAIQRARRPGNAAIQTAKKKKKNFPANWWNFAEEHESGMIKCLKN